MEHLEKWGKYAALARGLEGLVLIAAVLMARSSSAWPEVGSVLAALLACFIVVAVLPKWRQHQAAEAAFLIGDILFITFCSAYAGGLNTPLPALLVFPVVLATSLFADMVSGIFVALGLMSLLVLLVTSVSIAQEAVPFFIYAAMLAGSAMMVYEPAREVHRRRLELAGLQELMLAIVTIPRLEDTLRELVVTIALLVNSDICVFLEWDEKSKTLEALEPVLGLTEEEVRQFKVKEPEATPYRAFKTGQVTSASARAGDEAPEFAALMERLGATNVLCAPLAFENKRFGVACVFNRQGREFSSVEQQLLRVLATQAGVILEIGRLHRAVSSERAKLEAALESISSAVILVDQAQRIVLFNPLAEKWLRVKREEVLGKPLEVLPSEELKRLMSAEGGEELAGEITVSGEGEELYLQTRVAPIRGVEGEFLGRVAVLNDVTEIRRVERLKTEFVSTVSHELRTPLTSIKAFTRTLLREDVEWPPEKQREFLQTIDTQCDRLTRLISDLLDISRIESGRALKFRWEEVDLVQLLREVVEEQQSYTNRHELILEAPERVTPIAADRDKVVQIATNLISNAIKYSPAGGKITVRLEEKAEELVVAVEDEGIGIPADKLENIFNRFYQVDSTSTRKIGGTGIGLYLVKYLSEAHGGRVWVKSKVGEGSTFFFALPKVSLAEREAQEAEKTKATN